MRPGIKIIEETVGTGTEVVRGKTVVVNLHLFLPGGEELVSLYAPGQKTHIDLAKRYHIAGVRYGLGGMRVGGRRNFIISPHLAYGSSGLQDKVPPNTSLRCDVEVLEVRDSPHLTAEEWPPGKKMQIMHRGELAHAVPKWYFGLEEDGGCGGDITFPLHGLKWRHALPKRFDKKLDPAQAAALFQFVLEFPHQHPQECLAEAFNLGGDSALYVDDQKKTLCLTVSVYERGKALCTYYVPETSDAWRTSELQTLINDLMKPILAARPTNQR
ncbi:MAG: FKBP-type peptidyl-prolyl cis-trans isomerase [Kiritimatiellaeota bacterium]|nr:FKBP-type peptidyl-prolyl cis-trans isomerase [Kiritimatiellota bacterium]